MSEYHKSHDVSVIMYHLVLPAKYRRVVFEGRVNEELKDVCLGIEKRYEIKRYPEVWGGGFWIDGYFVNTVSKHGDEHVIEKYIKDQGKRFARTISFVSFNTTPLAAGILCCKKVKSKKMQV